MKIINFIFCLICVACTAFAQTPLQFEWAKQMGGKIISNPLDIGLDKAGNVYSTGYANDSVDFDPGPGVYKLGSTGVPFLFVSKLDTAGNFVWAKQVLASGGHVYGQALAVDSADNIYVTGSFNKTADFDPDPLVNNSIIPSGDYDVFIMKLNSSGRLLWVKTISGAAYEGARNICVDKNCNVYVAGTYNGVVDFDPSPSATFLDTAGYLDAFLCRLDSAGNFKYVRTFGGSAAPSACDIRCVQIGHNEDVIFGGSIRSVIDIDPGPVANLLVGVDYDAFVAKLDSAGNFQWAKSWGGANQDHSNGVAVDGKDNIYITGTLASPTVVMDPGPGTTVLTGGAFTMKLAADGKFLWATGVKNALAFSISIPQEDKIYTAGFFNSSADFDPGTGTFNLSSMGMSDAYVSLCDGNGNFGKAVSFGGTGTELLYGLATSNTGDLYTLGSFQQTVDFNPGAAVYNLSCTGTGSSQGDIFVHKMKFCAVDNSVTQIDNLLKANGLGISYQWVLCPGYIPIALAVNRNYLATSNGDYALIISNGTCVDTSDCIPVTNLGINEHRAYENKSFVYPNPSSGKFTIDIPKEMIGANAGIYNTVGQKVAELSLSSIQTITELPQGFYLLKIEKEQRTETIKLIIR